jgi:hypothetical protein
MTSPSDEKPQTGSPPAGTGIAIGIAIGVALGAAFDEIGLGIALGVALGAAFDAASYVRNKKPE